MGASAINFGQDVSLPQGKFGVGRKHVDGKGNFVLNALTGAVATREKFQVFNRILGSIPVLVMDGFFGKERAANLLFHHKPMLQHFSFLASGAGPGWNGKPNVTVPFDVAPHLTTQKSIGSTISEPSVFTRPAAKFLLVVDAATRFAALILALAAMGTFKKVSFIGLRCLGHAKAFAGAVQRIVAVKFPVRSQIGLLYSKRISTGRATKQDGCFLRPAAPIGGFPCGLAFGRTEVRSRGLRGLYRESCTAMFTGLFHGLDVSVRGYAAGHYLNNRGL